MASIINAVRNIASDNFWSLKLVVMAAPVFYILHFCFANVQSTIQQQSTIAGIIAVLYLGCGTLLMSRNINNISPILPSLLSIFDLVIKAIYTVIIIAPAGFLCYYCVTFVMQNFYVDNIWVMYAIYLAIGLLFAPFILIPLILYAATGKLTDAYRFSVIFETAGNFVVSFLSFLLQFFFGVVVVWYLIYILITEMLTDTFLLDIIHSVFIIISFLCIFSFASDLYGELIPDIRENKATFKY